MKALILIFCVSTTLSIVKESHAQTNVLENEELITFSASTEKGFNFDYLIYLPAGIDTSSITTLLVEPNNTGYPSNFMELHAGQAAHTAAISSVGNAVSKTIKIPLLVPIFQDPRIIGKYTHMPLIVM